MSDLMTEFREAAAAVRAAHTVATDARAVEIVAIAKSADARRAYSDAETRFRAAEQALAASDKPEPPQGAAELRSLTRPIHPAPVDPHVRDAVG